MLGLMAGKKGMRRGSVVERQQAKVFGELKSIVSVTSGQRMTIREATFARLVALEGYTHTDAYKEAYMPLTRNQNSIYVMACRIARMPRVVNEIERLKLQQKEEEENKDQRQELLRNGTWLKDQVLNGLYSIAVSDADAKTRTKAWELLGKSKHADVFASGSTFSQVNNTQVNNLGVQVSNNPDEMRSSLMNRLQDLLSPVTSLPLPQPESLRLIETKPVTKDIIDI